MFNALKKRLQETVEKVAKKIKDDNTAEETKKTDEKMQPAAEMQTAPQPKRQVPEEARAEQNQKADKDVKPRTGEHAPQPISWAKEEHRIKKQTEKTIEKKEHAEPMRNVSGTEKKPSFVFGVAKKIREKELSLGDVQEIMKELELAMLENDVALTVAEKIAQDVQTQLVGKTIPRGKTEEMIKGALKQALYETMQQETIDIESLIEKKHGPFTMLILGFNGSGKTTTLAKLAKRLEKFNPVLAAGDTFRAASIEQLQEHATRLNAKLIKHAYNADAAAVIFDAKKHAAAVGAKVVIADTAGRSHANKNLMDELKKVCRINNPDLKILVLDSLAGNDIYDQSAMFNDAVGVDAVILTKADVNEKGGAALSTAYTIKKPILFLATGQGYHDLETFDPKETVDALVA